jgi:hypothetical protein
MVKRTPKVFKDKTGKRYILLNNKKIYIKSDLKDKKLMNIVIKNIIQSRPRTRRRKAYPMPAQPKTTKEQEMLKESLSFNKNILNMIASRFNKLDTKGIPEVKEVPEVKNVSSVSTGTDADRPTIKETSIKSTQTPNLNKYLKAMETQTEFEDIITDEQKKKIINELSSLKKEEERVINSINSGNEEIEKIINVYRVKYNELENIKKTIEKEKQKKDENTSELNKLTEFIESLQNKKDKILEDIFKLKEDENKYNDSILNLKNKIKDVQSDLELKKFLETTKQSEIDVLEKELKTYKQYIGDYEDMKKDGESKIKQLEKQKKEQEDEINTQKDLIFEYNKKIGDLVNQQSKIEKEAEEQLIKANQKIKEANQYREDAENINEQLKKTTEKLFEDMNEKGKQLFELDKKLKEAETKLKSVEEKLSEQAKATLEAETRAEEAKTTLREKEVMKKINDKIRDLGTSEPKRKARELVINYYTDVLEIPPNTKSKNEIFLEIYKKYPEDFNYIIDNNAEDITKFIKAAEPEQEESADRPTLRESTEKPTIRESTEKPTISEGEETIEKYFKNLPTEEYTKATPEEEIIYEPQDEPREPSLYESQSESELGFGKIKDLRKDEPYAKGLWNYEIDEIMKDYKDKEGFLGVIPRDGLDYIYDKMEERKPLSFIMNTLGSNDKRVGHWVAINIDDDNVEYYDPLGDEPDDDFNEDIKSIVDKYNSSVFQKFKINKIKKQSDKTNTCGWHSMAFLVKRYNGEDFKDSTGYNDVINGEKNIKKVIKKYKKFGTI